MIKMIFHFFTLVPLIFNVLSWNTNYFKSQRRLSRIAVASTAGVDNSIDDVTTAVNREKKSSLKVPSSAWRWPKNWPFPVDYFDIQEKQNSEGEIDANIITTFVSYLNFSMTQNNLYIISSELKAGDFIDANNQFTCIEDLSKSSMITYDDNSFDNIAMLVGVESMTSPTSVMKEVWRVLKPEGSCFLLFSGRPQLPSRLSPIKMWTTMTDEQKIWIAGSYFHYSCFEGWENIEGYDLLSTTGRESMKFDNKTTTTTTDGIDSAYCVQARKIFIAELTDDDNNNFNSSALIVRQRLLGLKHLGSDDRKFLSFRLASLLESTESKSDLMRDTKAIEQIYETLKEVKEIVIPSPVKASLASSMFREWENSVEQISALRMSLGLDSPSLLFWQPVSTATKALAPRDKIHFLADLIPKFGKKEFSDRLEQFPNLIITILSILRERLPMMEERSLQLFATDLLLSDFLSPDSDSCCSSEKIVKFVRDHPVSSLETMVMQPIQ